MKIILFSLISLILLSSCSMDWNGEKDTRITPPKTINTGTGEIIKNLGEGFTLSQTDDETTVSYSGESIKTWSHTPPEKIPFTWDEACTAVWKGFEKLTPKDQSTGKQGVWDDLTEKEKKNCMKEFFGGNSIRIVSINERFYKITKSYYEGLNLWIYDTKSGNLQDMPSMGEPSIEVTNTGIQLKINYQYGDDRGDIVNMYFYDSSFHTLLSSTYDVK